jgi:choline dehydrogenase-like flavoprotein
LKEISTQSTFVRGQRAVGLEYTYNARVRPNEDCESTRVARAKRLVVVSAGALGSPQLLERSGIGRKDVLEKVGVKQLVDLAGVGENYQGMYTLEFLVIEWIGQLIFCRPSGNFYPIPCLGGFGDIGWNCTQRSRRASEYASQACPKISTYVPDLGRLIEWEALWEKEGKGLMAHK